MKHAIAILSDPQSGSEEALGRLFNALAMAHAARASGHEVALLFAGTGTRWPAELTKLSHPARGLYDSVRDLVQGASCGCAEAFGAKQGVEACGLPLLREQALPGTSGLAGLHGLVAGGWTLHLF